MDRIIRQIRHLCDRDKVQLERIDLYIFRDDIENYIFEILENFSSENDCERLLCFLNFLSNLNDQFKQKKLLLKLVKIFENSEIEYWRKQFSMFKSEIGNEFSSFFFELYFDYRFLYFLESCNLEKIERNHLPPNPPSYDEIFQ